MCVCLWFIFAIVQDSAAGPLTRGKPSLDAAHMPLDRQLKMMWVDLAHCV